jgi:hypothetical protein
VWLHFHHLIQPAHLLSHLVAGVVFGKHKQPQAVMILPRYGYYYPTPVRVEVYVAAMHREPLELVEL